MNIYTDFVKEAGSEWPRAGKKGVGDGKGKKNDRTGKLGSGGKTHKGGRGESWVQRKRGVEEGGQDTAAAVTDSGSHVREVILADLPYLRAPCTAL